MKRTFAAVLLALTLPLTARADDAAQHARAEELITLLHSDRLVNQVSANVLKQVSDAALTLTGANPSPEKKARLDDFDKKVAGMIDAELGWKLLGPQIADIYAKSFSEEELTAILAFYKSPAGTIFLSKAQDISNQVNAIAQPHLNTLQTQLKDAFTQFQKEQTAAAPGPDPSSGQTTPGGRRGK